MVEKIRKLCKKQGTSLTKLEQQLGFGNGVIGRWNKSKPSYDRLEKVANALGVPVSALTGEGQKNTAHQKVDGQISELMELFSKLSPEEQAREIAYLRSRVNE